MGFFKKFSAGLVLGALGLILAASSKEENMQMPPPPQVSAITIHKAEVPITYEYAGRIAAFKETEVRARVGGILLHCNFVEGSRVRQGDLLFEIDPAPFEAEVARQTALVAQAQATYDQSARDAARAEELLTQRVQSKALRDQTVARRDADAAALKQAQAALTTARLNLDYTKVTAPISGMTSRQAVPEGSLIGTDPSSSLLTTITQSDPIYVNFSYTDSEARKIRELMSNMNARGKISMSCRSKSVLVTGMTMTGWARLISLRRHSTARPALSGCGLS